MRRGGGYSGEGRSVQWGGEEGTVGREGGYSGEGGREWGGGGIKINFSHT